MKNPKYTWKPDKEFSTSVYLEKRNQCKFPCRLGDLPESSRKKMRRSFPYDYNRVKIQLDENDSDFVNASFIPICKSLTFIAAQERDFYDFLLMIFHHDIPYVITLRQPQMVKKEDEFEEFKADGSWEQVVKEGDFYGKGVHVNCTSITKITSNVTVQALIIQFEKVEKKTLRFVTDSPQACIEAMSKYNYAFSTYFTENHLANPLKIVVHGPDERAYSLFIGYYYLMYLAKNEPQKLIEKELWQHINDLRKYRWAFMPCCREYFNLMHHGELLQK